MVFEVESGLCDEGGYGRTGGVGSAAWRERSPAGLVRRGEGSRSAPRATEDVMPEGVSRE